MRAFLHIAVPDYEVIAAFAASNATLRRPLGVGENIPLANIKPLTASEHSLMPAGLGAVMKQQDLADLLSFPKGEAQ